MEGSSPEFCTLALLHRQIRCEGQDFNVNKCLAPAGCGRSTACIIIIIIIIITACPINTDRRDNHADTLRPCLKHRHIPPHCHMFCSLTLLPAMTHYFMLSRQAHCKTRLNISSSSLLWRLPARCHIHPNHLTPAPHCLPRCPRQRIHHPAHHC